MSKLQNLRISGSQLDAKLDQSMNKYIYLERQSEAFLQKLVHELGIEKNVRTKAELDLSHSGKKKKQQ
jgi:hypothetical protein